MKKVISILLLFSLICMLSLSAFAGAITISTSGAGVEFAMVEKADNLVEATLYVCGTYSKALTAFQLNLLYPTAALTPAYLDKDEESPNFNKYIKTSSDVAAADVSKYISAENSTLSDTGKFTFTNTIKPSDTKKNLIFNLSQKTSDDTYTIPSGKTAVYKMYFIKTEGSTIDTASSKWYPYVAAPALKSAITFGTDSAYNGATGSDLSAFRVSFTAYEPPVEKPIEVTTPFDGDTVLANPAAVDAETAVTFGGTVKDLGDDSAEEVGIKVGNTYLPALGNDYKVLKAGKYVIKIKGFTALTSTGTYVIAPYYVPAGKTTADAVVDTDNDVDFVVAE